MNNKLFPLWRISLFNSSLYIIFLLTFVFKRMFISFNFAIWSLNYLFSSFKSIISSFISTLLYSTITNSFLSSSKSSFYCFKISVAYIFFPPMFFFISSFILSILLACYSSFSLKKIDTSSLMFISSCSFILKYSYFCFST